MLYAVLAGLWSFNIDRWANVFISAKGKLWCEKKSVLSKEHPAYEVLHFFSLLLERQKPCVSKSLLLV